MTQPSLPDDRTWADVDDLLTRRAAEFDAARADRARAAEADRQRRRRRTDRQFWFLFLLMFGAFVLLAYRTESNDAVLKEGLYEACVSRVHQAQQYNEGRESLISAVVNNPENPVPPEKMQQTVDELRKGLLLPLEDCGVDPSQ